MISGMHLLRRLLLCEQQEVSDNYVLYYCTRVSPVNLCLLWEKYKDDLSEDFKQHVQLMLRGFDTRFSDEFINSALIDIEYTIISMGQKSLQTSGLPQIRQTIKLLFQHV